MKFDKSCVLYYGCHKIINWNQSLNVSIIQQALTLVLVVSTKHSEMIDWKLVNIDHQNNYTISTTVQFKIDEWFLKTDWIIMDKLPGRIQKAIRITIDISRIIISCSWLYCIRGNKGNEKSSGRRWVLNLFCENSIMFNYSHNRVTHFPTCA